MYFLELDPKSRRVLRTRRKSPQGRDRRTTPKISSASFTGARKEVDAFLMVFSHSLTLSRHGATVEEMTIEVNKAKTKLETAERDLKQMTTLNKVCALIIIMHIKPDPFFVGTKAISYRTSTEMARVPPTHRAPV